MQTRSSADEIQRRIHTNTNAKKQHNTNKDIDRQTDRQTHIQRERERKVEKCITHAHTRIHTHTNKQTNRQTDRQTDRHSQTTTHRDIHIPNKHGDEGREIHNTHTHVYANAHAQTFTRYACGWLVHTACTARGQQRPAL